MQEERKGGERTRSRIEGREKRKRERERRIQSELNKEMKSMLDEVQKDLDIHVIAGFRFG